MSSSAIGGVWPFGSVVGSIEPSRLGVYHGVQLRVSLRICSGVFLRMNWELNLGVYLECTWEHLDS